MTVYVDVLFLSGALMDYVTLLAATRLGGIWVKRTRVLLAALLGGLYSVATVAAPWTAALPLRLACGVLLCLTAFGKRGSFWRICALYYVVACAFAGLATALGAISGRRVLLGGTYYFAVPFRGLLLAAAVGYLISGVLLRGDAAHGAVRRQVETLCIRFGGRDARIRVLQDTGCDLVEPVSGKPVVVLGRSAACVLLGSAHTVLDGLTRDNAPCYLAHLPRELAEKAGLTPYRAVGTQGGLLLTFRPESVIRADGTVLDCVLAVSPEQMSGGYEGLIGV